MNIEWTVDTLKPFEGRPIRITSPIAWYNGIFQIENNTMLLTIVKTNNSSVTEMIDNKIVLSFNLPVYFDIRLIEPEKPSDIYSEFMPK